MAPCWAPRAATRSRGAMSPSMEKTPSVIISMRLKGGAAFSASSRTLARSAVSACLYTFLSAPESLTPSIMLPWLSSSLMMRSPFPASWGMSPEFAAKPVW